MKKSTAAPEDVKSGDIAKQWTFLNNHAHVLLCLARDPDMVLREVSQKVGITERATQIIVKDLVDCGVLTRSRKGRANTYRIDPNHPLRHPLESNRTVGELLATLLTKDQMEQLRTLWEQFQETPPSSD